jgi:hypothetical protein
VRQRAGAQFAVKGGPLLVQFGGQGTEPFTERRLSDPGDIQLLQGFGQPLVRKETLLIGFYI